MFPTLTKFRETRREVDDLEAALPILAGSFVDVQGNNHKAAGIVYDGDAYIERTACGSVMLTLFRDQWLGPVSELPKMERMLWDWCADEVWHDEINARLIAAIDAEWIAKGGKEGQVRRVIERYSGDPSELLLWAHDMGEALNFDESELHARCMDYVLFNDSSDPDTQIERSELLARLGDYVAEFHEGLHL